MRRLLAINISLNNIPIVYVLSDSIGETGEVVVKAALSQFGTGRIDINRIPYISTTTEIEDALIEASAIGGAVVYTLIQQPLKDFLTRRAAALKVPCVDIMGPVMNMLSAMIQLTPKYEPGLIRKIDDAYFSRVAAIEFAVKFDDGKEPRGLLKADIIIVGVSRTSKTPLCMYLAHKGLKAANVPLVLTVSPPEELFSIPPQKIIGLTIRPNQLFEIRKERLRTMGLNPSSEYSNLERILSELEFASGIMKRTGCQVIDVTNKAVEETAANILAIYRKGAKTNA